jgi:alpha/beta superfamily hydrolase
LQAVLDFAKEQEPPLPVMCFSETGHFFHGKLIELKSRLIDVVRTQVTCI